MTSNLPASLPGLQGGGLPIPALAFLPQGPRKEMGGRAGTGWDRDVTIPVIRLSGTWELQNAPDLLNNQLLDSGYAGIQGLRGSEGSATLSGGVSQTPGGGVF